jgi:hypothetical protein
MVRRSPLLPPGRLAAAGARAGGGVLLLLLGLAACRPGPPPERIDLRFTIGTKQAVTREDMEKAGGRYSPIRLEADGRHCRGGGGFARFSADSPIVVRNERGEQLGSAPLGPGEIERGGTDLDGTVLHEACHFSARIPLRAPARIYVLNIGGEGFVRRFHVSQLRRSGGRIELAVD